MAVDVSSKRRIAIPPPPGLADLRFCSCEPRLASFRHVHHRIKGPLVAGLDAVVHFDLFAEVTRIRDLLQMRCRSSRTADMQAVLSETTVGGR